MKEKGEKRSTTTTTNTHHYHHRRRQASRLAPLGSRPLLLPASGPRWLALSFSRDPSAVVLVRDADGFAGIGLALIDWSVGLFTVECFSDFERGPYFSARSKLETNIRVEKILMKLVGLLRLPIYNCRGNLSRKRATRKALPEICVERLLILDHSYSIYCRTHPFSSVKSNLEQLPCSLIRCPVL